MMRLRQRLLFIILSLGLLVSAFFGVLLSMERFVDLIKHVSLIKALDTGVSAMIVLGELALLKGEHSYFTHHHTKALRASFILVALGAFTYAASEMIKIFMRVQKEPIFFGRPSLVVLSLLLMLAVMVLFKIFNKERYSSLKMRLFIILMVITTLLMTNQINVVYLSVYHYIINLSLSIGLLFYTFLATLLTYTIDQHQ